MKSPRMPLPSLRPLRDLRAAWRYWRGFRKEHANLFPLGDALLGFSRVLAPQRLRHRLGWHHLHHECEIAPDPAGGYRVHVKPLGLDFFWPIAPDCDTWYALEQEVWAGHPHYYTTPPIVTGPQSTVLDVGACEGLFAFRLLRQGLAQRVIAFEPFPQMGALLNRGAAANGVSEGLHHEPLAVAAHPGSVGFRTDLGADGSQMVGNPADDFRGLRIEAVSLDAYVRRAGLVLGPHDLVKVDAEGADWDVLRGAERLIREHAPQIAVTTYHTDRHASEITAWLRAVQPRYRLRLKGFSYWTPTPRPVLLQASTLGT